MFDSIQAAANFAKVNAWTMSVKMQVFGYFEDKQGNKYYRQDEMNTKNEYTTPSPVQPNERKRRSPNKPKGQLNKNKTRDPIPVLVDGVYFPNCAQAERAIGVGVSTISNYLRQGKKEVRGHKIEYANKDIKETFQPIDIPSTKIEMPKQQQNTHSILIETDDPVIKMINDRIVKILKDAKVYDEIKKLSEAIAKLSK